MASDKCGCLRCRRERDERTAWNTPIETAMPRRKTYELPPRKIYVTPMIVCETCGNKRCPHTADHRNECTRSNEPGQPGSA